MLLKLTYDEPLSNCGFNVDLRRYSEALAAQQARERRLVGIAREFKQVGQTLLRPCIKCSNPLPHHYCASALNAQPPLRTVIAQLY